MNFLLPLFILKYLFVLDMVNSRLQRKNRSNRSNRSNESGESRREKQRKHNDRNEELYSLGKISKATYYMNKDCCKHNDCDRNNCDEDNNGNIIIAGNDSNIINVGDNSNVFFVENLIINDASNLNQQSLQQILNSQLGTPFRQ